MCNLGYYFQSIRDAVQECLQKEPKDRTEDDIETLLEFIQHFRVRYRRFQQFHLNLDKAITCVVTMKLYLNSFFKRIKTVAMLLNFCRRLPTWRSPFAVSCAQWWCLLWSSSVELLWWKTERNWILGLSFSMVRWKLSTLRGLQSFSKWETGNKGKQLQLLEI